MFITSADIPFSNNFSDACNASQTKWPVATIVTSLPSVKLMAFPISKVCFSSVKIGTEGLPNLR